MMEFSKEGVEKHWKILQNSRNADDTRIADEYLREFKVIYFIIPSLAQ